MNPITFNDKFAAAIIKHPRGLAEQFTGWQAAPLFDYETTWDKEQSLLQEPTSLEDVEQLQWPFPTFRLAMVERNVPDNERVDGTPSKDYGSHFVASKRSDGTVDLLIWWRNPRDKNKYAIMMHVWTYHTQDGHHTSAALYVPKHGGWELPVAMPRDCVATMAGSAIASFASFLLDCSQPSNHIAEVRPCRGTHTVSWQLARTHYTLISHGHPANNARVQERERVAVNQADELKRQSGNRRGHWRTYRHTRFTYARGSRRWVKQTWCGPKEWMDAGGRQIYKILEPVPNEPNFMPELPAAEVQP
jgi:hypothetical protein